MAFFALLIFFLFFAPLSHSETPSLPDPSRAQDLPSFEIEFLRDTQQGVPENFRFMIADFRRAGGQGRSLRVHSESKVVAGYYFAVDRLPPAVSPDGASLLTRDPKVLSELKRLQAQGLQLLLEPIDQSADARVWGDDRFSRMLRETIFPAAKNSILFFISPTMTEDILVHEMTHVEQMKDSHPLNQFLKRLHSHFDQNQLRKIRRVLRELFAYEAQFRFLKNRQKRGPSQLLTLVKTPPTHHVISVPLPDYLSQRLLEIEAASSIYAQTLSTEIRKALPKIECAIIDQAQQAFDGMDEIGQNIRKNYPELARCGNSLK